jgi:hypothetical protein
MKEKIPGTLNVATRLANGEMAMRNRIAKMAKLNDEDARHAFLALWETKLIKQDFCSGEFSVIHGDVMSPDVIERAVKYQLKRKPSSAKKSTK